jgi:hypothetical protein
MAAGGAGGNGTTDGLGNNIGGGGNGGNGGWAKVGYNSGNGDYGANGSNGAIIITWYFS